jgi:replicative DNA helicase
VTPALPHNLDAERGVIGAVLSRPDLLADLRQVLRPEDFYRENRQSGPAGFNPDEKQVI